MQQANELLTDGAGCADNANPIGRRRHGRN
jgi:hypothetical protein